MAKIKSQYFFSKLRSFVCQNSILRHCYIQDVEDGIQIRVYKISKECVAHFSHFISVKVQKILRKSQAQFRERLRKLRLRKNDGCLMETRVCRGDF